MSKTKARKLAVGVLVFFAIVAAATAPGWVRWFKVRRAFEAYSNSLVKQDYKGAYQSVSRDFSVATDYNSFLDQQLTLTRECGPLQSVKIRGTSVEGEGIPMEWHATVRTELFYAQRSYNVTFEFREIDGQWKVWGYRTEPGSPKTKY